MLQTNRLPVPVHLGVNLKNTLSQEFQDTQTRAVLLQGPRQNVMWIGEGEGVSSSSAWM